MGPIDRRQCHPSSCVPSSREAAGRSGRALWRCALDMYRLRCMRCRRLATVPTSKPHREMKWAAADAERGHFSPIAVMERSSPHRSKRLMNASLRSQWSFALASVTVCHCKLETASGPPRWGRVACLFLPARTFASIRELRDKLHRPRGQLKSSSVTLTRLTKCCCPIVIREAAS
jgi:hypothetical protein